MNIILDLLERNEQVSLARFNDGEIGALKGDLKVTSRGKQKVTQDLLDKLSLALKYENKNYFKGFPCPICYVDYYNFYMHYCGNYNYNILAVSTTNHGYVDFKKRLQKVLRWKKVLYIGGQGINQNWIRKNGWSVITVPNTDSSRFTNEILNKVDMDRYDVVLLAVGAVSRYLAMEFHVSGLSALDIGSMFDPETRNIKLKSHIWISKYKNTQKYCPICNHAGNLNN